VQTEKEDAPGLWAHGAFMNLFAFGLLRILDELPGDH